MKRIAQMGTIIVVLLWCTVSGFAFTLDFEGLGYDYMWKGGGQNLGDYYAGFHFGDTVTVLDDDFGPGYNSAGYPAYSGTAVIFSEPNDYIDMWMDTPAFDVSLWYSASSTVTLQAFDADDSQLDSAIGYSNYGSTSQLAVSDAEGRIKRIRLHDTGNQFTADYIQGTPNPGSSDETPEPATLILLGASGVLIGAIRRRRCI